MVVDQTTVHASLSFLIVGSSSAKGWLQHVLRGHRLFRSAQ